MDDKNLTQDNNNRRTISAAIIGGAIIALLLITSTLWINRTDEKSTAETVHSVSELYLRELIARREQIITSRIDARTKNLNNALRVLSADDLSDINALQSYLERMRITYAVNQFGFIDATGNVYTPQSVSKNTVEYFFADEEITDTKIFTEMTSAAEKNITLAVPVENVSFNGTPIKAVFLQLTISKFFEGVMMHTTNSEMTFFNLYYTNGESLTSAVLGEFKNGTNIVEALDSATFSNGYSKNKIIEDFAASREGVSVFTYHGVKEMLYYRPLTKAGWILTYMIRENQVAERISEVSAEMRHRSMFQIVLTILSMLVVFALIIFQARKNADLLHQKSLTEAESRIKSEEMEEKLRLQTQLLTEERRRLRQSEMIQALTVDYRLVYHLILDTDEAVCYRATPEITAKLNRKQSDIVKFQEVMKNYIDNYVASADRKELFEFIKPENIRARLAKEEMISQRYLTHYNGEEYFMMLRIAKIDDEMHAVGVGFANVDEQTRASFARNQELADALAQAQHANASKTVFLSNMSHDIRTPMNAIIGFTNLALRHFDNRTQVKDSLEKVLSSSNHLLGLINDILDMSRIESGRIEVNEQECNLSDLVHNLIHLIQPQITAKQQQFHIDAFKVKDEDVYADQLKINQVLINILSNAVKYTPATGSIFFRISQYESDKPDCARYEFRVKDNGLGMSKEFLKHVFDAFEREETSTKSGIQGTGLGMSITKKMVELMGGTIDVESEKDKGSEFTVTLDLRIQKDVIPAQVPELKNMRVLIVDDDFNNCESVNEMLKQVGMRSEWTTSPREAVFRAGRALDEDPFDLYIIDWLMPGQNGTETVRQIRRVVGDNVPIIILTAYDYSDVESEGKAAGVTTFCTKPLFMSDLKSAFKRALSENEETDNQQDEIALTDFGGKRVLLVEDIEVNREIAKAVLEEIGFEVEDADDGTVAVDMVKNAPLNHYDIILMDVQMPKMNGYDATRAIRALNRQDAKTVPIVAMTANAFEEDKANAINAGMNDHLAKPLDISKLIATLNKYLA